MHICILTVFLQAAMTIAADRVNSIGQRWYNVNVPTLDELRWSNIGTKSLHQQ